MNKKIISGIVALTMVASMAAFTANAQKLGDVNNDKDIDIIDAVTIISNINGLKPLEGDESVAADVNKDGIVDIEDAVAIIAHINGNQALPDEDIVTNGEDSQSDSKPDSSQAEDSSKPDSSQEESKPDSSQEESKPDSSQDESKPDDSSQADDETNTEKVIKKVSDGEFKVSGFGKVDYEGKGGTVTGFVEQKDGVTHYQVSLNGDVFEEGYTVGDKTFILDGAGDFEEGKSRFGKLAQGDFKGLIEAHSKDLKFVNSGEGVETFNFEFFDSIFSQKTLNVNVATTFDADGNPTAVSAINTADEKVVFQSSSIVFSDTTDDIEVPADILSQLGDN
jgi:hypothetical protein